MKLSLFAIPLLLLSTVACSPDLDFANTNPVAAPEFIPPAPTPPQVVAQNDVAQPTVNEEFEKEIAILMDPESAPVEEEVETIDVKEFSPAAPPSTPPTPKPTEIPKPKVEKVKQEPDEPEFMIMDEFAYSEPKIDILIVVDNSPSMRKEQAKLGERLQSFLKSIKHTDWQIAFTTSDVSNGKFGIKGSLVDLYNHSGTKVLTPNFPDAEEVFYNTVRRSEGNNCVFRCPSSDEQPLQASILAMQKSKSENANFFRKGADLAIVILSDEDESSKNSAARPQEVIDTFHKEFGPNKDLAVYGIIIQPNDKTCYRNQKSRSVRNANVGKTISQLTHMTNGYTGSICENDYSVALENISDRARYIAEAYKLKRAPIAGTVKVKFTPSQNVEWQVDNDHLTFKSPPKVGTLVQVSYQ